MKRGCFNANEEWFLERLRNKEIVLSLYIRTSEETNNLIIYVSVSNSDLSEGGHSRGKSWYIYTIHPHVPRLSREKLAYVHL